jgi:hypothetical protein
VSPTPVPMIDLPPSQTTTTSSEDQDLPTYAEASGSKMSELYKLLHDVREERDRINQLRQIDDLEAHLVNQIDVERNR